MYSIPAPVIKTILDHCDLPTAIVFARVTKRCSTIFKQYREEILIRGEYVNVSNMFLHCSDEFIITMSKHEFFNKYEGRDYCCKMRYYLNEKLGYSQLHSIRISKKLLREIYEKNDHNNIICDIDHKLEAAQLGIDLDIPYPNDNFGLQAALLLQDKKMINTLSKHGNFYTYCYTGYYHLADKYKIDEALRSINDSNNPLAAFEYIEKRKYKFNQYEYIAIKHYKVLKKIISRITELPKYWYITATNYDALMLLCNKLLQFTTIDKIFDKIRNNNIIFTRYLLQSYYHLIKRLYMWDHLTPKLLDLLDNEKVMQYACVNNDYSLIRALIKRNGRKWIQQFDNPFIKKYYM